MPETIEGQPKVHRVIEVPVPKAEEHTFETEEFRKATEDLAPEKTIPTIGDYDDFTCASLSEPINLIPYTKTLEYKETIAKLQADIDAIKDQVNCALSTVIEMIVGLEERFDALDARIVEFNRKGGHKL